MESWIGLVVPGYDLHHSESNPGCSYGSTMVYPLCYSCQQWSKNRKLISGTNLDVPGNNIIKPKSKVKIKRLRDTSWSHDYNRGQGNLLVEILCFIKLCFIIVQNDRRNKVLDL